MRIYKRDIEDNPNFKFREKQIYPTKSDGVADMGRQFTHLTCEEAKETDENGNLLPAKRVFEKTVLNDCIGSIITFKNCLLKI